MAEDAKVAKTIFERAHTYLCWQSSEADHHQQFTTPHFTQEFVRSGANNKSESCKRAKGKKVKVKTCIN